MSFSPSDNLRNYLAFASLPEMTLGTNAPTMPLPGHKSHGNDLKVIPQSYRILERVWRLDLFEHDRHRIIKKWLDRNVPSTSRAGVGDMDPDTGKRLSLPCHSPMFSVPPSQQTRPVAIEQIIPWLDNLPLTTAARAFQIIHPERADWQFVLEPADHNDHQYFRHFLWTLPPSQNGSPDVQETRRIKQESVAVILQPPWVLSDQDIQELCSRQSFPNYRDPGHAFPRPFNSSKERAWAKIWDTCVGAEVHWFVVTSYNKWVFGRFAQGYSVAQVMGPFNYDAQNPSIAELLVAWMSAPLDARLADIVPQPPEPASLLQGRIQLQPYHGPFPRLLDSESNWDGKDDEVRSSAGLSRYESPAIMQRFVSPDGVDMVAPPVDRQPTRKGNLDSWLSNLHEGVDPTQLFSQRPDPRALHQSRANFPRPANNVNAIPALGLTQILSTSNMAGGHWVV